MTVSKEQELEAFHQRFKEMSSLKELLLELFHEDTHDLRARLRGMAGYADMVLSDDAENLDEDSIDYLRTVKVNGKRLGEELTLRTECFKKLYQICSGPEQFDSNKHEIVSLLGEYSFNKALINKAANKELCELNIYKKMQAEFNRE